MAGYPHTWFLCGGWAVDAWLGRQTREHADVDFAIFEDGLDAIVHQFAGWSVVAHDERDQDSNEPWNGRKLMLPAHLHIRRDDDDLDVPVNERHGGEWVLCQEPRLTVDLATSTEVSNWGLRALVPEIILFFKALDTREKDEGDLVALLPLLGNAQLAWLRDAVALARPGHVWLPRLQR